MRPYEPGLFGPPERPPNPPNRNLPEPGNGMGLAFKFTFFPIVGISVLSLFGASINGLYFAWFVAVGYGALAVFIGVFIALISFFNIGESAKQAAAGMVGGAAVGVIVLTVTCFINIATYDTNF